MPKEKDHITGRLSFSTIPAPGSVMTTKGAINSTGILYAVQDKLFHVSVRPMGTTIKAWIDAGPNSIWTKAIKTVVVKWDGGK